MRNSTQNTAFFYRRAAHLRRLGQAAYTALGLEGLAPSNIQTLLEELATGGGGGGNTRPNNVVYAWEPEDVPQTNEPWIDAVESVEMTTAADTWERDVSTWTAPDGGELNQLYRTGSETGGLGATLPTAPTGTCGLIMACTIPAGIYSPFTSTLGGDGSAILQNTSISIQREPVAPVSVGTVEAPGAPKFLHLHLTPTGWAFQTITPTPYGADIQHAESAANTNTFSQSNNWMSSAPAGSALQAVYFYEGGWAEPLCYALSKLAAPDGA